MRMSETTTAAPCISLSLCSAFSPLDAVWTSKSRRRCNTSPSSTRASSSTHSTRGRFSRLMIHQLLRRGRVSSGLYLLAAGNGEANDETRSPPRLALHVDSAAMLFSHDRAGDCQALAGAFADFLGGEEWIEDLIQVLRRDAAAVVADRNRHVVVARGGRDGEATVRGIFAGFLNRVRRIDDEIEEYLVQLADVARHLGQGCKVSLNDSGIFVFVAGDVKRGLDRPIDVSRGVLDGIWVGEFVHRAHDSRDAVHAIEGALESLRYLDAQ